MIFYVLLATLAVTSASSPPTWPTGYTVNGLLTIPFAEVQEPFAAFFDVKRSRIDFYGGMDKVFQRGDLGEFGSTFKLVPMTDENMKVKVQCVGVNGSADAIVKPQSVLPDLTGFVFKGKLSLYQTMKFSSKPL